MNDINSSNVAGTNTNSINATNGAAVGSQDIVYCPRCGAEMKRTARCCIKCGGLNYDHPDNASMKQYALKNINHGTFVPSSIVSEGSSMANIGGAVASESDAFRACFITNLILHVCFIILGFVPSLIIGEGYGISLMFSLLVGLIFILNYSIQCVLIKGGQPWWSYFVPFYSNYTFYEVAMGNGWLFLLCLIPIIGFIVPIIALFNLGKRFYKSGWLTLFFPYIMIPIIGLDRNSEMSLLVKKVHSEDLSVDMQKKTKSEKAYHTKKIIVGTVFFIIVGVTLFFCWPYIISAIDKLIDMIQNIFIFNNYS